jgi:hypothetical protein
MYKLYLYMILVVVYLGLAKTLSPSELGVHYLQNEKGFSEVIKGTNASLILVDTHSTGFFIKTYYQKYRMISSYDNVEEIIVRTSKEYARRNLDNIGLSLYRRLDSKEEFVPLPPGSHFLGNREYGEWKANKQGDLQWRFNKTLKNFPTYLGWGDFIPDMEFYKQMKLKASLGEPFYGLNNEFGANGKITKDAFPHFFKNERMTKVEMKNLLIEYFKENF